MNRVYTWKGAVALLNEAPRLGYEPILYPVPTGPLVDPDRPVPLTVGYVFDEVGTVNQVAVVGNRVIASGDIDMGNLRTHDETIAAILAAGQEMMVAISTTPGRVPTGDDWQVAAVTLTMEGPYWRDVGIALGGRVRNTSDAD